MPPVTPQPAGHFSIAADHPALPGHFPGRPVVPGVVLLDAALALLSAAAPACAASGLRQAKFLRPVLPGQQIEVFFGPGAGGVSVTCRRGADTVMSFTIQPGTLQSSTIQPGAAPA